MKNKKIVSPTSSCEIVKQKKKKELSRKYKIHIFKMKVFLNLDFIKHENII